MFIYPRIRDLREDNDKTQSQIAKVLNMQLTVYQRYERGEREIPFWVAIKLADYYKVSLDYIAGRIDNFAVKGAGAYEKRIYEYKICVCRGEASSTLCGAYVHSYSRASYVRTRRGCLAQVKKQALCIARASSIPCHRQ